MLTNISHAQWLVIKDSDDVKTRNKKKKLQKSYKSKLRFQKLDMETKGRQKSWLDFKTGKGAKKKACLLHQFAKDSCSHASELSGQEHCPRSENELNAAMQAGFLSTHKKGSMFSVPDELGAKVLLCNLLILRLYWARCLG